MEFTRTIITNISHTCGASMSRKKRNCNFAVGVVRPCSVDISGDEDCISGEQERNAFDVNLLYHTFNRLIMARINI